MCHFSYQVATEYFEEMKNKICSRKHFPTFESICFDDDRMNRWILTFFVPTKKMAKMGRICVRCHTTYDIPPKRCENQTNAGKGVIDFDPILLYQSIHNMRDDSRGAFIFDYVPHAINRYTDRYLKPNGFNGLEMRKKMEKIYSRYTHFDIDADRNGDISSQKQIQKNGIICPYDIIMKEGGMFRGGIVDNRLIMVYTYVSPSMMYETQTKRATEMTRERYDWEKEGRFFVE